MGEQRGERGFWRRFALGTLPILAGLGEFDVGLRYRWAFWPAYAACAAGLWLGRRWIASTVLTRAVGIAFAILLGLLPALVLTMTALVFGPLIGFLFCLTIPVLLWDFFVVQPRKGRFERAREERRGVRDLLPEEDDSDADDPRGAHS